MPRPLPTLAAAAASLAALLLNAAPARAETPIVVDASVGALRLGPIDDYRFTGNATLGYATPKLGLVGSGWFNGYAFENAEQLADYTRFEGQGEGWLLTGSESSGTRFELRATGGGVYYSNTLILKGPGLFLDEDTWMGRGTLFAGLFVRPDEHFRLEAILGGGFQYTALDDHLQTGGPQIPVDRFTYEDTESFSIQGQTRLSLRWSFLPGTLGTRINARAYYFTISRATYDIQGNAVKVEEQTQFELFSKLFVDVEALSFFGITPGAYAGLDLVRASGTVDLSTTVPSAGLGLFRDIQ